MSHANSATGIASFSIAVPDPAAEIARCEKILDTRGSSLADGSAVPASEATNCTIAFVPLPAWEKNPLKP